MNKDFTPAEVVKSLPSENFASVDLKVTKYHYEQKERIELVVYFEEGFVESYSSESFFKRYNFKKLSNAFKAQNRLMQIIKSRPTEKRQSLIKAPF
ncbi:hypothetical protein phi1422_0014 [Bdellovibrio phage phi1422]|uniref:hypothetical protein n=1 Tax=Bdellovibrio phage phi1422 TaxID=1127515 RepID=UPI0002536D0D|nr:hypothetical protein F395_gp14 [Bdellovibrio phage phi1422]AFC22534.1 hypothetical protein phi1422_0014 [Bdellovibrio phage phi1422]